MWELGAQTIVQCNVEYQSGFEHFDPKEIPILKERKIKRLEGVKCGCQTDE